MKKQLYRYEMIPGNRIHVDSSLLFRYYPENFSPDPAPYPILPLLVFPENDQFILLDGYARFCSLQGKPDHPEFPALVWEQDLISGLLYSIHINYSIHPYTIIEEIGIIRYLLDKGLKPNDMKKLIPEIQAPLTSKYFSVFNKIHAFPNELKLYLKNTHASFKQMKEISVFPEEILLPAIRYLPLASVKIKDLIEILLYMYTYYKKTHLLEFKKTAEEIFHQAGESASRITDIIKSAWWEKAYPEVVARLKTADSIRKKLESRHFKITFDRNLENREILFRITLSRKQDLDMIFNRLNSKDFVNHLKELLDLFQS
jgi:hypothetical protein